jgi:hypothetical protein
LDSTNQYYCCHEVTTFLSFAILRIEFRTRNSPPQWISCQPFQARVDGECPCHTVGTPHSASISVGSRHHPDVTFQRYLMVCIFRSSCSTEGSFLQSYLPFLLLHVCSLGRYSLLWLAQLEYLTTFSGTNVLRLSFVISSHLDSYNSSTLQISISCLVSRTLSSAWHTSFNLVSSKALAMVVTSNTSYRSSRSGGEYPPSPPPQPPPSPTRQLHDETLNNGSTCTSEFQSAACAEEKLNLFFSL